jgi:prolyl oligopeptidase
MRFYVLALIIVPMIIAAPPETRKDSTVDTIHGVAVPDPYRWLEDQQSPETRAWLKTQEAYMRAYVDKIPRRAAIEKRLGEFARVESTNGFGYYGGRLFHLRRSPEQDQFVLVMRQGLEGKDEVLIDPNPWGGSKSVTVRDYTSDGKKLAYGIQKGGEDEVELHFYDVDARKDYGPVLPRARYMTVNLMPGGQTVYYVIATPAGPRLYEQQLGGEPKMIFGEKLGPVQILLAELSPDARYLKLSVLEGAASAKDQVYVLRLADRELITINESIRARFEGSIGGDTFFALTNWKAPQQRVLAIDLNKPEPEHWKEIVAEGKWNIQSMNLVGGHVSVFTLENVQPKIRLYTPQGKLVREVKTPGMGTASNVYGEWGSDVALSVYHSTFDPTTTFVHSIAKGTSRELHRTKVPLEKMPVVLEQKWFTSKDGTKVPMFIAHRKDRKLDGNNPTLLYGYGGFNLATTPTFSNLAAWWIENGGVYAIVNLRGGAEFGEPWHETGMLDKKQNTFDDFIGAAEWLIANKYTKPARLAIRGGSNGGLLVGAAMTQRPELFGAVSCLIPLLDMVRYHLFKVARYWVPEYGSSEDPKQFAYIRKYSPYHNVKPGTKYPATIFISGDNDTRVDPLHARKMAALVQAANGAQTPILLHYDTEGGHSGGLPVAKQIANTADELSFLVANTLPDNGVR